MQYLLNKPLYKLYDITIDDRFFEQPCIAPVIPQEKQTEEGEDEPLIESIVEHPENAQELLLAQQKTLMWSEEKYLSIAPGMNQKPENIIFDEHAEELSFPSIYLGEARTFKIPVTHFMIATSEIRRDRRGVKPEHILYMAMKIMRVRLNEGLRLTFKCTGDTAKLTRADLEDKRLVEKCIENNLSFLKSIPNSIQYWMGRKKDVFAMMRQLAKPMVFLTMMHQSTIGSIC